MPKKGKERKKRKEKIKKITKKREKERKVKSKAKKTKTKKEKRGVEKIKISVKKPEKVSTGIKNLDRITGGGFNKGSINLLVGGSGNGKSVFAIQFLLEGIRRGEKCLYINFEERKEDFYTNMLGLGWDLYEYEKEKKFFFLYYTPEKVKKMLEEGGGEIETIILTENIKRVAIDSITAFAMLFEEEIERREAALALFNLLRKWDVTSLLTYERDPLVDKRQTSRVLEFESDSIIFMYFVRLKRKRERFLEVYKLKGTDHSKEIYPYKIGVGGIKVGKRPYRGDMRYFKIV